VRARHARNGCPGRVHRTSPAAATPEPLGQPTLDLRQLPVRRTLIRRWPRGQARRGAHQCVRRVLPEVRWIRWDLQRGKAAVAITMLGWPKRCKLARAFLWEYSDKGLKLAQLLANLASFSLLRSAAYGYASGRGLPGRPRRGACLEDHDVVLLELRQLRLRDELEPRRFYLRHTRSPPSLPPVSR
jgi:hypothetical protein